MKHLDVALSHGPFDAMTGELLRGSPEVLTTELGLPGKPLSYHLLSLLFSVARFIISSMLAKCIVAPHYHHLLHGKPKHDLQCQMQNSNMQQNHYHIKKMRIDIGVPVCYATIQEEKTSS
jgi:hypothetical protein